MMGKSFRPFEHGGSSSSAFLREQWRLIWCGGRFERCTTARRLAAKKARGGVRFHVFGTTRGYFPKASVPQSTLLWVVNGNARDHSSNERFGRDRQCSGSPPLLPPGSKVNSQVHLVILFIFCVCERCTVFWESVRVDERVSSIDRSVKRETKDGNRTRDCDSTVLHRRQLFGERRYQEQGARQRIDVVVRPNT